MNKTESQLFAKSIISSIDNRLFTISADLAEYLEPICDKLINQEACNILNEIRKVVDEHKPNPTIAIDKISEILNRYNLKS